MSAQSRRYKAVTSHGFIAVSDTGGPGVPLLLIHGNSSCKEVFARQMDSALGAGRRLIAIDLPGHGQSDDAPAPERTYSCPGLADAIIELLEELRLAQVAVLGWSLGGHVAIELAARSAAVRGLILTGSPPVPRGGMGQGFVGAPLAGVAGRAQLSPSEIEQFGRLMFGEAVEPFLLKAIARADGRCRQGISQSAQAGEGVDQRLALEASKIPVAVINGENDPLVRLDYFDQVAYGRLWGGCCYRLAGVGHAPFWHAADAFNHLVDQFLTDLDDGPI